VVRKIDYLPLDQEMSLCNFFLLTMKQLKDAEFFRSQLKQSEDFSLIALFRELCFSDQRECYKVVSMADFKRFFHKNSLMIEQEKIRLFYDRVLKCKEFNLTMLNKLITSSTKNAIISSVTTQVQGFSVEHRRTEPIRGDKN
jgi:hypothetical protein